VDFDDVTDYVNDNAAGTASRLTALYRTGFPGQLMQASSMVVYGEGRYLCAEHGEVAPGPRRAQDLADGRWQMAISSHRARRVGVPWPRPR